MYITLQKRHFLTSLESGVLVWLGRAAERGSDNKKAPLLGLIPSTGGGGGIRTLVTRVAGKTVFETAAFNHSATPPRGVKTKQARRPALELTGGESGI